MVLAQISNLTLDTYIADLEEVFDELTLYIFTDLKL